MHDELLAEFFVMLDQIGVEEVLVGIVFASKLLNDRGIELVADFFEIVSRLMVGNFAHRESPAFGVDAWPSFGRADVNEMSTCRWIRATHISLGVDVAA
jgi:hypothetical protein